LSASADASLGGLSAGLNAGLSGGLSAGLSAGVSAGVSAGLSADISARGVGAIGGSSSAGVSAIAGAFAGLHSEVPALPRMSVDVDAVRQRVGSAALSATSTTGFSVGGRASADGASGLSADVGAGAALRVGISFDE
jgi:hypothetical protein